MRRFLSNYFDLLLFLVVVVVVVVLVVVVLVVVVSLPSYFVYTRN